MKQHSLAAVQRSSILRMLALFSLVGVGSAVGENANVSAKPEGVARLEALRDKLGLTDEQLAKLKPALEEQASRLKAIREDGSLSEEQKREKARNEPGEVRKVMEELLTPEQKVKLAEMMKARAGEKPGTGLEQRLRGMRDRLGLSDEQVSKIRPILEEEAPKLRDASPDQRRELLRESLLKISSELTPEQLEKMKEQFRAKKN